METTDLVQQNHIEEVPSTPPTLPPNRPSPLDDSYLHRRINAVSQATTSQPAPLFEVAQPDSAETQDPDKLLDTLSPQISFSSRLIILKVHVILLAIVVRILLAVDQGHLFGNMVLVPIFVVELTLFLTGCGVAGNSNQGGLLGAALILSGFGQNKAHSLLRTLCVLQDVAADMAIYLFIFLLSHVSCLWLGVS